jgi:hypothetical protein
MEGLYSYGLVLLFGLMVAIWVFLDWNITGGSGHTSEPD